MSLTSTILATLYSLFHSYDFFSPSLNSFTGLNSSINFFLIHWLWNKKKLLKPIVQKNINLWSRKKKTQSRIKSITNITPITLHPITVHRKPQTIAHHKAHPIHNKAHPEGVYNPQAKRFNSILAAKHKVMHIQITATSLYQDPTNFLLWCINHDDNYFYLCGFSYIPAHKNYNL